ncbi:hypothetical protein BJ138DRAFT_1148934 [Hygrophoropsis aurantiaca]|uniref:Uncharacterized protein n=1 Tax=Hygrophoropsis aurantiaca TaxID=72124 RepID=A0ACB8AG74_9AGAM|nr:hypothetical protein BJ138DRAFT_1148934 [Hygrophoropsis aurantiaca]
MLSAILFKRMDQDLNNIEVATITNDAVGQRGDCIASDSGLGSKLAALIAIATNQQTMIEGLIDEASDERRVTNKRHDKIKVLSTRIKDSTNKYGMFRDNLRSEIIELKQQHRTQQEALGAMRQEMGRRDHYSQVRPRTQWMPRKDQDHRCSDQG